MSTLVIVVPKGRRFCGRSALFGADGAQRAGPFRTLATASVRVAKKRGNPSASPLRPFGHPPQGTYLLAASLPPGYVHAKRTRRYGRVGGLLLAPQSGEALDATAHGRELVALHGGPLDRKRRLRPTRGGIRLTNHGMIRLLHAINAAQADGDPLRSIEVYEIETKRKGRRDRKGKHRLLRKGARRPASSAKKKKSANVTPMLLVPLGLGGLGKDGVERRHLLRAIAIVAGAIALDACNVASPSCGDPVACDPSTDPSCPPDGYVCGGGYG